ncbi:MAG: hypothetical protein AAF614_33550 [Chloroflexota bacterium]
MTSLTTRQRNLLQLLLDAESPLSTAELATNRQLTPRQVNYDLKGLKQWLAERDVMLTIKPRVGVRLACTPEQAQELIAEVTSDAKTQLVLSGEQRQQLLALILLEASEPFILYQLQQHMQVSRSTVLKDLDVVADCLADYDVILNRRPNYGIWIEGSEWGRRQALAAWVWGEIGLGQALTKMTHMDGLVFALEKDVALLSIVQEASDIIAGWNTQRALWQVANAEAQLDGRFTDNAVLHLSLVLAIQTQQVQNGRYVAVDPTIINQLKILPIWSVAAQIARRLAWSHVATWPDSEIAAIAMQILAAPRNDRWPGDLDMDASFADLIDELMRLISQNYKLPSLHDDTTLRDGLVMQIIPACMRARFHVWLPSSPQEVALSKEYVAEYDLAHALSIVVKQFTQVALTSDELNNMVLLLRATYIRKRPNRLPEIVIVCPSGMATAQLLMARLKVRVPRLNKLRVVSMRDLADKIGTAELIITTTPLPASFEGNAKVIQVHPLLLPEDIETITRWLF